MSRTLDNLKKLQRLLQYHFKDIGILKQALTHKSASSKNNERLEYLGDSILNFVVADALFEKFGQANEGELTRCRATLVRKATLSELATEFQLGDFLQLGIGEQRSGGFRRDSILADALEAVVGAIYLDAGFADCRDCVRRWFASRLDVLEPKAQIKDPKTRLQEWLQSQQMQLPNYEVISTTGEPHAQMFYVSCEVKDLSLKAEGKGASRRIAEQQAAAKVWEQIHESESN